jgi:hypothetical protein
MMAHLAMHTLQRPGPDSEFLWILRVLAHGPAVRFVLLTGFVAVAGALAVRWLDPTVANVRKDLCRGVLKSPEKTAP